MIFCPPQETWPFHIPSLDHMRGAAIVCAHQSQGGGASGEQRGREVVLNYTEFLCYQNSAVTSFVEMEKKITVYREWFSSPYQGPTYKGDMDSPHFLVWAKDMWLEGKQGRLPDAPYIKLGIIYPLTYFLSSWINTDSKNRLRSLPNLFQVTQLVRGGSGIPLTAALTPKSPHSLYTTVFFKTDYQK